MTPVAGAGSKQLITIAAAGRWTAQIEWGIDRFGEAGLQLPPMSIMTHVGDDLCDGNSGLYKPMLAEIHLCVPGPPDSRVATLTILHELAHAWAETQLDDARRTSLLHLRKLLHWVEPDTPRHQWGAEHAAEVVSWGLMSEEITIIRINDAEPDQLAAAFRLLVGRQPLWAPDQCRPRVLHDGAQRTWLRSFWG